eukprot:9598079-Karenia_brevis.AAC.1
MSLEPFANPDDTDVQWRGVVTICCEQILAAALTLLPLSYFYPQSFLPWLSISCSFDARMAM